MISSTPCPHTYFWESRRSVDVALSHAHTGRALYVSCPNEIFVWHQTILRGCLIGQQWLTPNACKDKITSLNAFDQTMNYDARSSLVLDRLSQEKDFSAENEQGSVSLFSCLNKNLIGGDGHLGGLISPCFICFSTFFLCLFCESSLARGSAIGFFQLSKSSHMTDIRLSV